MTFSMIGVETPAGAKPPSNSIDPEKCTFRVVNFRFGSLVHEGSFSSALEKLLFSHIHQCRLDTNQEGGIFMSSSTREEAEWRHEDFGFVFFQVATRVHRRSWRIFQAWQ